jgi:hypothetical protein
MPLIKSVHPPAGGWRGCDPAVVTRIAQLLKAARLIEGDTPIGRRLLAPWAAVDSDDPDMSTYTQLVAELEPAEIDYEAAFHSLMNNGEDN